MKKQMSVVEQKGIQLRDHLFSPTVVQKIKSALPRHMSEEHLLRVVMNTAMRNPRILECSIESVLMSVMQCATLGLEPILGRAYLVPYNNSKQIGGRWTKVMECQMQPGYVGLIDLARRSGKVVSVFGAVVHDNDHFVFQLGSDRKLEHRPILRGPAGDAIGAYAFWEMSDGGSHMDFMPLEEIYKRRARSQAWQYAVANPQNKSAQDCPWVQWPEEMMIKTVIKRSSKMVPASISQEFSQAVDLDDAVEVGARYNPFADSADQIPERTPDEWARDFDYLADKEIGSAARAAFDAYLAEVVNNDGRGETVVKAEIMTADDWPAFLAAFRDVQGGAGVPDVRGAEKPKVTKPNDDSGYRRGVGNPAYNRPPDGVTIGGQRKDDNPWLRDKWWNLRAGSLENNTGLWSYVVANRKALSLMPLDEFGELAKKFQGLYKKAFPYNPDGDVDGDDQAYVESENANADPGAAGDDSEMQQALADLARVQSRYPKAYEKIVGDNVPGDLAAVVSAIEEIEARGEFTQE